MSPTTQLILMIGAIAGLGLIVSAAVILICASLAADDDDDGPHE